MNLREGGRIRGTVGAIGRPRIRTGEPRYGRGMFDERTAVVRELRPLAIHGMAYVDIVLTLEDGKALSARLGPEAVPQGLSVGDRVVAVTVLANVIELRPMHEGPPEGTEPTG